MTVSNEMECGQVVIGTQENPWGGRNNENSGLFTAFQEKAERDCPGSERPWQQEEATRTWGT